METTSAIVCDPAIAIAEDRTMFYLKAGFHTIADLIAICDPRSYGNQPLLSSKNMKTKRTIAYSNPTTSCPSPRLKSAGKKLGKTGVFIAVRQGFAEGKPQIKTAIRPRQNRGKWSNSFRRYCS